MTPARLAIKVSSLGRAARNQSGIKLRQPLRELVVVTDGETQAKIQELQDLIREELNVKSVKVTGEAGDLKEYELKPKRSILGRKHGKLLPQVVEAIARLPKVQVQQLVNGAAVEVSVGESTIKVQPDEVEAELVALEGYSSIEEPGILVGVYTEISEELRVEGLSRDVVRRVQALRKEADFEIDDMIETYYSGDEGLEAVFEKESEYISTETLSKSIIQGEPPEVATVGEFVIEGMKVKIGLRKAKS